MKDALIWTAAAAIVVIAGPDLLDHVLNHAPAIVWHKP